MENKNNCVVSGLSSAEARNRLKQYGDNVVFKKKRIGPVLIFLSKFNNPLIILLIIVAAASYSTGSKTGSIFICFMILLSTVMEFINSFKSQKAVEKLVGKVATKVTVCRDGRDMAIGIKEVVPGDIVKLSAGNVIPADCRVVESDDFFVNQSAMTGESIPVEKVPQAVPGDDFSPQNISLVFMGTSVVSGFATVEVIKTGTETSFGKIAENLVKKEPQTDFELNMKKFSIFIMKVAFYMVSFVFVVYLLKNYDNLSKGIILEAFAFALAITIGLTPDMLPAITTICLSKGSQLMGKKDVIVKNLSAIENFGSMDILCTDKTGTLTQDRIALVKCVDYSGIDSDKVFEFGYLNSFYHTGVENMLDNAIKDYKALDVRKFKKIDEIPYDFTRKRSSMVVERDGKRYLIVKGAPEEIFKVSKYYEFGGAIQSYDGNSKEVEAQFSILSEDGFRVLGLAYKEIPMDGTSVYDKKIEKDMIFLGYLAFLDPPKDSVRATIDELEELGITIKVLTGDNELLTRKICRDIGLEITGMLTGKEISRMNDRELELKANEVNIFARITPDQKERIILAFKRLGKSVGYLGDGINDAPALKAADVGISVNNATDIAKDTADIILLQKSLEVLKDGIIEGRKTFHNTLKYVMMGLSSNFGNMFSMMGASAFLPFLPMLPSQILFNNFIYDVSQFSLPSDEVDSDQLLRPAHWDLKLIRAYMIVFGLVSSVFDFLTFYLLYFVFHLSEHQFQTGWFIESIATQIFVIYVIRTKKIPFIQSKPSKFLMTTTIAAVVFAWTVQYWVLGRWLEFDILPGGIMLMIAGYVILYLLLVEGVKRLFYKMYNRAK